MDAGASKGVIYARIQMGMRSVLLFNTHLQATHTDGDKFASIRTQQLKQLQRLITRVCHSHPAIPWYVCITRLF
jgi:hypothetical protein